MRSKNGGTASSAAMRLVPAGSRAAGGEKRGADALRS
jgi:hypothetical protein